jgi:hypothetical protein
MEGMELIITIIATFVCLGLFSILLGFDTPFFAVAEHMFVGIAIGYMFIMKLDYLNNNVITRLTTDFANNWPWALYVVLGLMLYTRLVPSLSYIARLPLTIVTGVGVAMGARTTVLVSIFANIKATILPLLGDAPLMDKFTNFAIVFMVVTILTSFIYTRELKGPLGTSAKLGRYALYAGFGALFSQTFVGRVGLFTGRMETLLFPAENFQISIIVFFIILIGSLYLKKYKPELLAKLTPE